MGAMADTLRSAADNLRTFGEWVSGEYASYSVELEDEYYPLDLGVAGEKEVSVSLGDEDYRIDVAEIVQQAPGYIDAGSDFEEIADQLVEAADALDDAEGDDDVSIPERIRELANELLVSLTGAEKQIAQTIAGSAAALIELATPTPMLADMALAGTLGPEGTYRFDTLAVGDFLYEGRITRIDGAGSDLTITVDTGSAFTRSRSFMATAQKQLVTAPALGDPYRAGTREEILARFDYTNKTRFDAQPVADRLAVGDDIPGIGLVIGKDENSDGSVTFTLSKSSGSLSSRSWGGPYANPSYYWFRPVLREGQPVTDTPALDPYRPGTREEILERFDYDDSEYIESKTGSEFDVRVGDNVEDVGIVIKVTDLGDGSKQIVYADDLNGVRGTEANEPRVITRETANRYYWYRPKLREPKPVGASIEVTEIPDVFSKDELLERFDYDDYTVITPTTSDELRVGDSLGGVGIVTNVEIESDGSRYLRLYAYSHASGYNDEFRFGNNEDKRYSGAISRFGSVSEIRRPAVRSAPYLTYDPLTVPTEDPTEVSIENLRVGDLFGGADNNCRVISITRDDDRVSFTCRYSDGSTGDFTQTTGYLYYNVCRAIIPAGAVPAELVTA